MKMSPPTTSPTGRASPAPVRPLYFPPLFVRWGIRHHCLLDRRYALPGRYSLDQVHKVKEMPRHCFYIFTAFTAGTYTDDVNMAACKACEPGYVFPPPRPSSRNMGKTRLCVPDRHYAGAAGGGQVHKVKQNAAPLVFNLFWCRPVPAARHPAAPQGTLALLRANLASRS